MINTMNKQYLKRLALLPFLAIAVHTHANVQAPPPGGTSITTNIVYGEALNLQGLQQALTLDVYTPPNSQPQNPLIVFIHGGSFLGGSKEDMAAYCQFFAQKGFTTATISYRLGWNTGPASNACGGDPESLKQAGYRAIQDARAALRFLATNAAQYKIDPQKIFLAGESAGATTALSTAFMDQAECDVFLPAISQVLGSLDGSGNNYTANYTIKGVINMWGGLLDLTIINPTESIPVLSFHGTADKVTPYEVGSFNECANFMQVYGSKPIYDLLSSRNVNTVLHASINGGHGVFTFDYRANNILCFVTRILRNESVSGLYNNFVDNCTPITLPVRFNEFNLQREQTALVLNWQTVEEQNSLHYQVERSQNGYTFTTIATIPSKEGPDVNTYSYRDQAPADGKNYYRLRQVDKDGSYTYSPVRLALWHPHRHLQLVSRKQGFTVYCYSQGRKEYFLYSIQGHLVQKGVMTGNECTLTGLTPGQYLITIQTGTATMVKRVMVAQ